MQPPKDTWAAKAKLTVAERLREAAQARETARSELPWRRRFHAAANSTHILDYMTNYILPIPLLFLGWPYAFILPVVQFGLFWIGTDLGKVLFDLNICVKASFRPVDVDTARFRLAVFFAIQLPAQVALVWFPWAMLTPLPYGWAILASRLADHVCALYAHMANAA